MARCEVIGCKSDAAWAVLCEGVLRNVCGMHRMQIVHDYEPNPTFSREVSASGDVSTTGSARGRKPPAGPADGAVPEVPDAPSGDDAEDKL